jgi:hypothetical protein
VCLTSQVFRNLQAQERVVDSILIADLVEENLYRRSASDLDQPSQQG